MYIENLEELITLQSKEFLDTPLGKAFQKLNSLGIRAYKDCGISIDDGLIKTIQYFKNKIYEPNTAKN